MAPFLSPGKPRGPEKFGGGVTAAALLCGPATESSHRGEEVALQTARTAQPGGINNCENDLEVKYRRSVLDVAILQDHIAFQRESVKNVQSDRIELKRCLRHTEQKLQHDTQDHRDVHSDLSRRYNAMQTEMTSEVQRMEKEVSQLSEKLVMCQQELSKETREREQVEREKDSVIADLRQQLELMETDYEKILHENLDSLSSQLSAAQRGWEGESTAAHPKYEALLSEFGLNARNI